MYGGLGLGYGGMGGFGGGLGGYGMGGGFWGVGAVVVATLILIAIIAVFCSCGFCGGF